MQRMPQAAGQSPLGTKPLGDKSKETPVICQDCQGRGYPSYALAGSMMPCLSCGGSGITSCCEGAVPGDDTVVLRLPGENRLIVRQELYHAVHTLEAQARVAKAGSTRQRALTRRAEHLRAVADQLA